MRAAIAGVLAAGGMLAIAAQEARADVLVWPISLETVTREGVLEKIQATLMKPEGGGPFPAIVMLHDCSGLGPRSSGAPWRWGDLLAGQGYVVILPDSFSDRGFPRGVCSAPPETPAEDLRPTYPIERMYDAYAALAFLRRQPYVDGAHIGVMGGSHGGSSTLAAMVQPATEKGLLAREKRAGFAAGVALYPGCGFRFGTWTVTRKYGDRGPVTAYDGVYRPIAPLLILVGEKDDWTPARDCEALAERSRAEGSPLELVVYPGARHSFDSDRPIYFDPARRNPNADSGLGATTEGDAAAWDDSIKRITAFFGRTLKGEVQ